MLSFRLRTGRRGKAKIWKVYFTNNVNLSVLCRICFGANRTDDICSIHRYREKYEEPFEMDTKTDFNNNRRDSFAYPNYGSEDSWNDYISLAKISLVDLMLPQMCRI